MEIRYNASRRHILGRLIQNQGLRKITSSQARSQRYIDSMAVPIQIINEPNLYASGMRSYLGDSYLTKMRKKVKDTLRGCGADESGKDIGFTLSLSDKPLRDWSEGRTNTPFYHRVHYSIHILSINFFKSRENRSKSK